jgi:hypothetical protein
MFKKTFKIPNPNQIESLVIPKLKLHKETKKKAKRDFKTEKQVLINRSFLFKSMHLYERGKQCKSPIPTAKPRISKNSSVNAQKIFSICNIKGNYANGKHRKFRGKKSNPKHTMKVRSLSPEAKDKLIDYTIARDNSELNEHREGFIHLKDCQKTDKLPYFASNQFVEWSPEQKNLISKLKNRLELNRTNYLWSPRALRNKFESIVQSIRPFSRNELKQKAKALPKISFSSCC